MYDLHLLADAPIVASEPEPERQDLEPQDRLVTAAILAATAFRLKDMEGLLLALRALVDAVSRFERGRDAA